jgi:hypothetical protein
VALQRVVVLAHDLDGLDGLDERLGGLIDQLGKLPGEDAPLLGGHGLFGLGDEVGPGAAAVVGLASEQLCGRVELVAPHRLQFVPQVGQGEVEAGQVLVVLCRVVDRAVPVPAPVWGRVGDGEVVLAHERDRGADPPPLALGVLGALDVAADVLVLRMVLTGGTGHAG